MTELLDDKMRVACIVLEKLSKCSMRWTELEKAVLKESPTPWKLHSILDWLLDRELIEKTGPPKSIAPYRLTEKGLMFLTTLRETYRDLSQYT